MSWQIQTPDHAARKFSSEVITTKLITLNKRLIHALKSLQFCDVRNRDSERKSELKDMTLNSCVH